MITAGGSPVLQASTLPTGAIGLAQGIRPRKGIRLYDHCERGSKSKVARVQGRSDLRQQTPLHAGSCPKCGKAKIKRRKGRKACPRCGPIS